MADDFSGLFATIGDESEDLRKIDKRPADLGPRREYTDEERDPRWSDYARGLAAGTLNLGSGVAALTEYATGGKYGGDTRRALDALSKEQMDQTSLTFQRGASASFLPDEGEESVFDVGLGRSLLAKATVAAPSMVASVIPAGLAVRLTGALGASLATRIAVGGAVGKGAASLQNAGDVTSQIYQEVDKISNADLMKLSPRFQQLVAQGADPTVARKQFMSDVAGIAPIIAGAITYATGGVEGQIGRRLGGEAAKGVIRGAAKGAAGEAVQEAIESGTGEALSQYQLTGQNLTEANWRKILAQTIEGGVVGAAMGGVSGGVSNIGGKKNIVPTVDPVAPDAAQAAALNATTQPSAPVPPTPGAETTQGQTPGHINGDEEAPASTEHKMTPIFAERLAKKGITVDDDMRADLDQRIQQIVADTTVEGKTDGQARQKAYRALLDELYAKANPVTQQGNEAAVVANDAGQNVTEKPETLKKQRGKLLARMKAAVLFTDPATVIPLPANSKLEQLEIPQGIIQYNPRAVTKEQILAASQANDLGPILGLGPVSKKEVVERVKKGEKPVATVLQDKNGEVASALGTEQTASTQAAALSQMAEPGETITTKPVEDVVRERAAGIQNDINSARAELNPQQTVKSESVFERNPPKIGNQQPQFSIGGYRFVLGEHPKGPSIEIFNPDRGGTLVYDHDNRAGGIHTKGIEAFLAEKGLPKELAGPMRDYMTQTGRADDPNAPYHVNAQNFINQITNRIESSLKGKKTVQQTPAHIDDFDQALQRWEQLKAEQEAILKKSADERLAGEAEQQRKQNEEIEAKRAEIAEKQREALRELYIEEGTRTLPNGRKILPSLSEEAFQSWLDAREALAEHAERLAEQKAAREAREAQAKKQELKDEQKSENGRTAKLNTTNQLPESRAKKDGKKKAEKINTDAANAEQIITSNWGEGQENRAKLRTRLNRILAAAKEQKIKIPLRWGDATPVYLGWLRVVDDAAKKLNSNKDSSFSAELLNDFAAKEFYARRGRWDKIVNERRDEGDAAKKMTQSENIDGAREKTKTSKNVDEDGREHDISTEVEELNGNLDELTEDIHEDLRLIEQEAGRATESVSAVEALTAEDIQSQIGSGEEETAPAGAMEGRERPKVEVGPDAYQSFGNAKPAAVVRKGQRVRLTDVKPVGAIKLKPKETTEPVISKNQQRLTRSEEDILDELVKAAESGERFTLAPEANGTTVKGEGGTRAQALMSRDASEVLGALNVNDSHSTQKGIFAPLLNMVRKKLIEAVGNVQIHVVSNEDFARLSQDEPDSITHGYSHYNPKTGENYVVIPERTLGSQRYVHTVLHELVHSATIKAALDPKAAAVMGNIKKIMAEVKASGLSKDAHYGLTNATEFIAEALSNPDFQRALMDTKISSELAKELGLPQWRTQSLYAAVINAVRSLLNTLAGVQLPYRANTALEAIIQQSEQLMLDKLPQDQKFYAKTMDLWGTRNDERRAALESRTEDKLAYIPKMVKDLPSNLRDAASDILRTMLGEKVPFWSDLKDTSAFTFSTKSVISGSEQFHPGEFITDIYNEMAREYFYARKNRMAEMEADRKAILDELDKRAPATNDFMREYDARNIRADIEKLVPAALPYLDPLLKKFENREISLRRLSAEANMISEDLYRSVFSPDEDRALADALHSAAWEIERRLPISLSHASSVTMQNNFENPFLPAYETGKPMVADVVHGTSYLFDQFSKGELGKTTGAPSAREGFFFARTPDTAQRYADMSEGDILSKGGTPSQRLITARIKMDNPLVFDFEGERGRVVRYSELIKQAKEEGRDGVVMMNTHDGGPTDTIYVVFDESQISDRFKPRDEGVYFPLRTKEAVTQAGNVASDTLSGVGAWLKKMGMKGMSLPQLAQQFAGSFMKDGHDLLERLTNTIRKMDPYADSLRDRSNALAQEWIEHSRTNPAEANKLADFMQRVTMAGVHVGDGKGNDHIKANTLSNVQARQQLAALEAEFATFSPESKALYRKMAAFYTEQQTQMARGLVENILDTLPESTKELIAGKREDMITKIMNGRMSEEDQKLFGPTVGKALAEATELRKIQGTYFPLMRFGDHVVETLDKWGNLNGGKVVSENQVEFRGDDYKTVRAQAEKFLSDTELRQQGAKVEYFDPATGQKIAAVDAKGLNKHEVAITLTMQRRGVHFFESGAAATAFRRGALNEGYEKVSEVQSKRDTAMGSQELTSAQLNSILSSIEGRKDISEGTREMMRAAMYQASARLMAGNRVQKRSIARTNVAGASTDFGRVALQYGEATSRYLAKIKFMPEIRQTMADMRKVTADNKYESGQADRVELLNQITERLEKNVIRHNEPSPVVQTWLQLSYLDKLGSLAYSITNGMQTIMVTYPTLAGRFGSSRTAIALAQAYSAIGAGDAAMGGLMNTVKATKQFAKTSLINTDDVLGSILTQVGKQKDGAALTRMLNVLVEQGLISKESGFELASSISQGQGTVRTNLSKVDRIARQLPVAIEAINRSTSAIAAFRLAVQSGMSEEKATQFALNTVNDTQGDYRSSLGPTAFNNPLMRPALQFKRYAQMMTYLMADMTNRAFRGASAEERSVARKQLMQLAGVQIAMAGALSLPGIEIAKVGFMIAAALGFGDGWDDQEEKLRRLAADTLGKTWSELLMKGVVSRAIGIDLSSRVSLADLWTFGEPKSADRNDLAAYAANWALGAPGSLALDWMQGVQEAGKGNYLKATELLLPLKTFADMAKAARQYGEGRAGIGEVGLNIIGLRSANQANQSEEFGDKKRAQERKEKEFKDLRQQFFDAKTPAEKAKAISRNREWNRDAPLKFKLPTQYNEQKRAG